MIQEEKKIVQRTQMGEPFGVLPLCAHGCPKENVIKPINRFADGHPAREQNQMKQVQYLWNQIRSENKTNQETKEGGNNYGSKH